MTNWTTMISRRFNVSVPEDYLSFDLETTGGSPTRDLPIDIGWCVVRGGKAVQQGHLLLDWTQGGLTRAQAKWLDDSLDRLSRVFAERGDNWIYTPEYVMRNGREPLRALAKAKSLFEANRDAGGSFVGHGAMNFDVKMLEGVFAEYLDGPKFEFPSDRLWDTGGLEKSLRGDLRPDDQDESLRAYFERVHRARRPGLYWSLATCVERYGLSNRSGVDPKQAHQAKYDAWLSHLVFEEHRDFASHFVV